MVHHAREQGLGQIRVRHGEFDGVHAADRVFDRDACAAPSRTSIVLHCDELDRDVIGINEGEHVLSEAVLSLDVDAIALQPVVPDLERIRRNREGDGGCST